MNSPKSPPANGTPASQPLLLPDHPLPGWTLRPLACADVPAALELDRLCFGGIWSATGYQREIDSPQSALVLVETHRDPHPVGLGCFWTILDEAHVTLLGIRPDWRGRGLGQLLLVALLQLARQRQMKRATLEVRASNRAALSLYEKLGFRVAGRRRNYYQSPSEDALILWRSQLDGPQFSKELATLRQAAMTRLHALD